MITPWRVYTWKQDQDKAALPSRYTRLDGINDTRIGQGAEVTQLVALSGRDLAHDTTHDLARSGLGEVWNDDDLLRSGEGSDDLPDLEDELLDKGSLSSLGRR
jgi:hypothetical protein